MRYLKERNRSLFRFRMACLLLMLGSVSLQAQSLRFRVAFTYETTQFSSMLIIKKEGEVLMGSMMNEFGVNMVAFSVNKGKVKIIRFNPVFKKPFFKKVLKRDFALLADCIFRASDEIVWSNKRGIYQASCVRYMDEENKWLSLHLEHQNLPLTIDLYPF